jgi:putative transcriptional regulator
MRSRELAARIGMSEVNLSLLKTGRVKGIRFDTLDRICAVLDCQPGDLLAHGADPPDDAGAPVQPAPGSETTS